MILFSKCVQVQSLPWILALLVEGDIQCNRDYQPSYINSQCSATLVSVSLSDSIFIVVIFQIGSNFAITAAHCVINSDTGKVRPASSLSVLPGMKDRSTPTLVARWGREGGERRKQPLFRYEVAVVKVLVHEGFIHGKEWVHDIALIKLSKLIIDFLSLLNLYTI